MIADRCPGCASTDLILYSEPDGDEHATWLHCWFSCDGCGERFEARLVEGEFQPIARDEEEVDTGQRVVDAFHEVYEGRLETLAEARAKETTT